MTDMFDDIISRIADGREVGGPPATATVQCEEVSQDGRARLREAAESLRFITAGDARFTVVSERTGDRFTYRVSTSDDGRMRFVSLLTGSDNESSYQYFGHVRVGQEIFQVGRKSQLSADLPSVRGFDFVWRCLAQGRMPPQAQLWHEGRCGRCGRTLTVPESIASGFGPECAGKIGR